LRPRSACSRCDAQKNFSRGSLCILCKTREPGSAPECTVLHPFAYRQNESNSPKFDTTRGHATGYRIGPGINLEPSIPGPADAPTARNEPTYTRASSRARLPLGRGLFKSVMGQRIVQSRAVGMVEENETSRSSADGDS
jgi:hypothetical protein